MARPEGILTRWIEILAEFSYTIEHRSGRLHSNADEIPRPFCKQCWNMVSETPWVDEFDRADELTEVLGLRTVRLVLEITNSELAVLQAADESLGPVIERIKADSDPTVDDLRVRPLDGCNLCSQTPSVYLQTGVRVHARHNDDTKGQFVVPMSLRQRLFEHAISPLRRRTDFCTVTTSLPLAINAQDVNKWCTKCLDCAESKEPSTKRHGKLRKVFAGAPPSSGSNQYT